MTVSADLKNVCGCGMTVQADTKDELMSKVKQHASEAHQMQTVPPEIANKLNMAIKEW